MTTTASPIDPKTFAEQQRLLTSVLAAGRGVADYNLTGKVAVGTEQVEKTSFARAGLEALVKKSKEQTAAAPASNAKPEQGLGPIPRGAASLAADYCGHALASFCGGPVAGGIYLAWAAGRSAQGLVRSAGAAPGPSGKPAPRKNVLAETGYANNPKTPGKGSDHIGSSSAKGSSYTSFADEAAPIQPATKSPRQAAAKQPGKQPDFNFNAITLTQKQAAAAEKLLPQVKKQEENIDRLATGQTRMRSSAISSDKWNKMSFAEQYDAKKYGVTLGETGHVSTQAIRQFSQRHHEPSPAQQMALTGAAPAPSFG